MNKWISIVVCSCFVFGLLSFSDAKKEHLKSPLNVLVFSKTDGFRHLSIPEGIKYLREISDEQSWKMTATEDASFFNVDYLKKVDVVIFLNTTGNVLNKKQEGAFENYIKKGGGFVGVHSASDTELNWSFYHELIGAQFKSHPRTQEARLIVNQNSNHPALSPLGKAWVTTDEWYYFKDAVKPYCNVLLELDESTIKGKGNSEKSHPIAWYHEKFGGRTFYTGLGHTKEQYTSTFFREHLKHGILWAGKRYEIKAPKKWVNLLDKDLTHWERYIGVPHTSVTLPFKFPKKKDVRKGRALGLNNDPLNVFSIEKDKEGNPNLHITGEIYGGLTTKNHYQNYHFKCEFKWGDKKWEPRLNAKRDSGILFHAIGAHGAFWNVWMRSLECQVQEQDFGDFFPLSETIADIKAVKSKGGKTHVYDANAKSITSSFIGKHEAGRVRGSKDMEKPRGEWNTIEIYTIANRAVFVINGELVSALTNTRYEEDGMEIPLRGGRIQIQSEAAEAYYKSIQIRGIDDFPDKIKKLADW